MYNKDVIDKKAEAIYSLHKYWVRADVMRLHFTGEREICSEMLYPKLFDLLKGTDFYSYYYPRFNTQVLTTHFDYWIGGIFCVLEGHKKLDLEYIDTTELDYIYNDLKDHRDNVFHFQSSVAKTLRTQQKVGEKIQEILDANRVIGQSLLKEVDTLGLDCFSCVPPKLPANINLPKSWGKIVDTAFRSFFTFMSYWEQANIFKCYSDSLVKTASNNAINEFYYWTYTYYWYGALCALVEGYKALKYQDKKIDAILCDDMFLRGLNGCRHSAFHYEKVYYNNSLVGNIIGVPGSLSWMINLHEAFNDYMLRVLSIPGIQYRIIEYLERIHKFYAKN